MTDVLHRTSRGRWGPRGTAAAAFASSVTFDDVSLAYGDNEAVCHVSFELKQGEIVCLLGPSGCGKSTLMRLAAGVERPDSGRILLDNAEVASERTFIPPEKRSVGLMFQDYALFPHLTVLGNVTFGLKGVDSKSAISAAQSALLRVGLGHLADTYPHELSGGEQQRVALARAIVPRPAVLLMDEPFSGLDQRLREHVRHETLAILKETRASSILVTHDPEEAMGMADRIVLMRNGRVVQIGTPDDLYRRPADAEAARFFSDVNELRVYIENGAADTPLGRFDTDSGVEGGPALVMIRPQAFVRTTPDYEGAIAAQVTDQRFLGDKVELSLLFEGLNEVVFARVATTGCPSLGEKAYFRLDPDHVLVFDNVG
ncbi:MAG: ABC transporter ATP-binding protein [Anderseniella sp.]